MRSDLNPAKVVIKISLAAHPKDANSSLEPSMYLKFFTLIFDNLKGIGASFILTKLKAMGSSYLLNFHSFISSIY